MHKYVMIPGIGDDGCGAQGLGLRLVAGGWWLMPCGLDVITSTSLPAC